MSIARPKYGGEAPRLDDAVQLALGRFRFSVRWRVSGTAKGVTLHVFGPVGGSQEEVLRFDCFDHPAHYHLGWSYRDERFVVIDSPDPLAWSLSAIEANLPALLAAAGAEAPSADEMSALPRAVRRLREIAASLLPGAGCSSVQIPPHQS